ncbi:MULTISPECIES: sarcosine oxidase subunit gamma family protein [unclassified Microbulbifer]|uniref:sarcosine oxidase subunit gamma n=1 Tax=unclassified Microbulbifer TaxID=2619833 RepID=UPI0027E4027B|nr:MULTISPECIES: sarcosine oxidase subunit gamma family protein [unclassified Microbulbifer]
MSDVIDIDAIGEGQVAVMDQLPSGEIPAESPLHHLDSTGPASTSKPAGVRLWEEALKGHLVLRGNAEDPAFQRGVEAALGMALPERLRSIQQGPLSLRWIAPDEWLLVCPGDQAAALEIRLRRHLSGHFAVVNVSGGQTLIHLAGPDAAMVLKKSCPYDLHERNFPIGKVVTTVLAKTQATLCKIAADQWELVVRRSFADYAWRWLVDASAEYGLIADTPATAAQRQASTGRHPVSSET